uniref:neuron navigator 2 n=1 Tax=Ciona intestinalis TaxID=7719 RepID=UPI000180C78B|nr:neuron navigator 2 [Ciona intestinalis]|eukprot:XP_002129336.1 neuron navigator 2 [Ciona intestinalis]
MEQREENELDKLRKTIEELRAKAERSAGNSTAPSPASVFSFSESKSANTTPHSDPTYTTSEQNHWGSGSAYSAPVLSSARHFDALSPNSPINKRISSGSLSSMSSHASHSSVSSASSGSSGDSDGKHKKKRWLPLKSAFSKSSKTSQSNNSGQEFTDADDSGCMTSPNSSRRSFRSASTGIGESEESISYNEILQIVQEKDRKLTDVRLEALTSQHQLHQLKDQIAQMQHEMQLLRLENERLQAGTHVNNGYINSSLSPSSSFHLKLSPLASPSGRGFHSPSSPEALSTFNPSVLQLDCSKLYRAVSPGSEDEGSQIRFVVETPYTIKFGQNKNEDDILIGSLPVARKTNWAELDQMTGDLFTEYCRCVDGDSRLGLSIASIAFYKVGEQTRIPGSRPPELLPCAFMVGDVDSVKISLKDATCGSVELMAFRSLVPRDTLQRYITSLMHKTRIMLHGPSGTGKTYLAHSLAQHMVARARRQITSADPVFVYDVKQRGEEDLQIYIKKVAEACKTSAYSTLPYVIIVENNHLLTSLTQTYAPIVQLPQQAKCPYVIGTILQGKAHRAEEHRDEFTWISCKNNSAHVKDYLARFLRKAVVECRVGGKETPKDEFQNTLRVITWLPLCWHQVNRCLEAQCAADVTIGPRVFASFPVEFYSSCTWFVQVWNHVIAPYVIAAVRRIRQSAEGTPKPWADPTEWVIDSFPWNASDMGGDVTLRLKRITSDDLDCPPVPPRTDLESTPKHNTLPRPPSRNRCAENYIENYLTDRPADGPVLRRQNSKNSRSERQEAPPVPPMELIGLRNQNTTNSNATVWHRHNSPVTSPSKTVIHTGGRLVR